MKNRNDFICFLLRIYIYIAMCVKMVFIIKHTIVCGDINYLCGELVAWTIVLVSPICDYLISHNNK